MISDKPYFFGKRKSVKSDQIWTRWPSFDHFSCLTSFYFQPAKNITRLLLNLLNTLKSPNFCVFWMVTHSKHAQIWEFEQLTICWEHSLIFYSFDICFNVSIEGTQDLTRSNAGNSVIFHCSRTPWDVTSASLQLLK